MDYGIVLKEKRGIDGLNQDEIMFLFALTSSPDRNQEVYPIELEAREHESSAMGFITRDAASAFDYDYEGSGLRDFVATILDDMRNENEDCHYKFKDIDIYMSR